MRFESKLLELLLRALEIPRDFFHRSWPGKEPHRQFEPVAQPSRMAHSKLPRNWQSHEALPRYGGSVCRQLADATFPLA